VVVTISGIRIKHVVIRVSGYSRAFRNDEYVSVVTGDIVDRNALFFFYSFTSQAYTKHMMAVNC
jgi:hypothetical protein